MFTIKKVDLALNAVYGLPLGTWILVHDGKLAGGPYRLKRAAQSEADFQNAHAGQLLIVVGH